MVVRERIVERLRRYARRDPGTVYVHMLDVTLAEAVRRAEEPPRPDNGYFIVGELVHAGVEAILEPAPTVCREYAVWRREPVHPLGGRFVRAGRVRVCGTADALVDGYVVEVKTTARSRPPVHVWRKRAFHYAALYHRPAVLFIVDRRTGETTEMVVEPPRDPDAFLAWAVNEWLRGRYPRRQLDTYRG